VELVTLKKKLIVLGRLENELGFIQQRIGNEQNLVSKAKIVDVSGKMSMALTGKDL
jgi:hypothetical protein